MIIRLKVFEATWVAMSVGLSIISGFVTFVALMNDTKEDESHDEKREKGGEA